MTRQQEPELDVVQGVFEAWADWLTQHSVTVPDCIIVAVEKAVSEWLSQHDDVLVDAIAKAVAEQSDTHDDQWADVTTERRG